MLKLFDSNNMFLYTGNKHMYPIIYKIMQVISKTIEQKKHIAYSAHDI